MNNQFDQFADLETICRSIFEVEKSLDRLCACLPESDQLHRESEAILEKYRRRRMELMAHGAINPPAA